MSKSGLSYTVRGDASGARLGAVAVLAAGLLLALAALLTASPSTAQTSALPSVPEASVPDSTLRVAVVTGAAGADLVQRTRQEVQAAFAGVADVAFGDRRDAGGSMEAARRAVRDALDDPDVNAVVAVGPFGARAAARVPPPAKPLVALDLSGALAGDAASSTPNRALVPSPARLEADLRALVRLVPAQRVAVLVDARTVAARGDAGARAALGPTAPDIAASLGLRLDAVPVTPGRPLRALADLAPATDAVYLAPILDLSGADAVALGDSLQARGLPSLAAADPAAVEHGLLASVDRDGRQALARRAAVRLRELVETGRSTALDTDPRASRGGVRPRLVVNERVAEALGLDLPWAVRLDARLVDATEPAGPLLSLAEAMQESVAHNLSLQIDRFETEASAENVQVARSRLLPDVDVRSRGRVINEEQAAASLGSRPERLVTGTASFRQILFSEAAFANLSIQRRRQAAEEFTLARTRLEAAEQAATAYTGLLRARAQARIQRDNLELALANLEAARTRRRLGASGPAEVSRLETTVGRARRGVAQAAGEVEAAEIAVNQAMNRSLDAPVRVPEQPPEAVLEDVPYRRLLERPAQQRALRAFFLKEARTQAPAIKAADRLVSAQRRRQASAERSFYLPEVAVEGSYTQWMDQSGAGAGVPAGVPQNLQGVIVQPPENQWSLGLTVSFPLFQGTRRGAERARATEQVRAARTQRQLAAQRVEQRVRTAFARLEAAYVGTQQAQAAAQAAQRSLDVVQASYREGEASVLDLLDAQNRALVTQTEAADAAYDFHLDWIRLQRAAGSFAALRSPAEAARYEARFGPLAEPTDDVPVLDDGSP